MPRGDAAKTENHAVRAAAGSRAGDRQGLGGPFSGIKILCTNRDAIRNRFREQLTSRAAAKSKQPYF
jgi:hypothetical protein